MNFFQRIKTGRLFSSQNKKTEETIGTIPDVITKFIIKGRTFILEEFDINFNQELNDKGQPGGIPKGGIMTLTISEISDSILNDWILSDNLLHSGEIRVLSNEGRIDNGALLIISFTDAYCVGFKKKIQPYNGGLSTVLTISPRLVKFGDEEFENKWRDSERYSH